MRIARAGADPILLLLTLLATALGIFVIYDAGFARSIEKTGSPLSREAMIQVICAAIGTVILVVIAMARPSFWRRTYGFWWTAIFLMVVAVPVVGTSQNGAQRWLKLGPLPVQPSEFCKFGVILLLAGWFARREVSRQRKSSEGSAPVRAPKPLTTVQKLFAWVPALTIGIALLAIEHGKDMGTLIVVLAIALFMAYAGGVNSRNFLVGLAVLAIGGYGLVNAKAYRKERFANHARRWDADKVDGDTYQAVRAEADIAMGGLTGVGLGNGHAKQVIPAPTTDYVMATVGEETGLAGSWGVLAILSLLVWRLMWMARRASDAFAAMVLSGTAAWIGFQTAVNVCMVMGLIPPVGIPVPFISSGGSSLIGLFAAIGLGQSAWAGEPATEEARRAVRRDRRGYRRTRLSRA